MSVRITVHCNQLWQYGSCTSALITDALTTDEARAAADQLGWRTHPDGNDYCPTCSGSRRPHHTRVIHLLADQRDGEHP